MGDISDYYREIELEYHHKPLKDKKIKKEEYKWWVQKDGNKIKVKSMTISHLKNSIKLILKNKDWRQNWLIPLKKQLSHLLEDKQD